MGKQLVDDRFSGVVIGCIVQLVDGFDPSGVLVIFCEQEERLVVVHDGSRRHFGGAVGAAAGYEKCRNRRGKCVSVCSRQQGLAGEAK